MQYNKIKNTKRFNFSINSNNTAKKAGSNIVTISTNPSSDGYSYGGASLTLTQREARALNVFLSAYLVD